MANPAKAHVLVVDDSPGVLRIAETILSEAGLTVTCVDNGEGALEMAAKLPPQLVLLDFTLPDIGGYDVCRRLGENPELEGIPIVIMSARGDPVGDRFIRELGVVDHITKPFPPEALRAVVQHSLKKPNYRRRPFSPGIELRDHTEITAARRLADEIADAIGNDAPETVERIRRLLEAQGSGMLIRDLFFERIDRPGLTGDLSVVPIAEVLQMLSLQRQSGFLRVVHKGTVISIALASGVVRLVTGENVPEEFLLGNILIQEKMMDAGELDLLLGNRKGTRRRLGTQIVKLGYITKEQLHQVLRRQSSELVYEMLRWSTGRYTFTPADELPEAVLEFEFDLTTDELLMEGFRRVDEWGLIEGAIPSLNVILTLAAGADQAGHPELNQEEQAVLRLVDGKRTAREIVQEVGSGTFEATSLLYRLVSARVIRHHAPQILPAPVVGDIVDTDADADV